jgi:hypothetical protein
MLLAADDGLPSSLVVVIIQIHGKERPVHEKKSQHWISRVAG